MENTPLDWETLKKNKDINFLAKGDDSKVYKFKNKNNDFVIAKEYDNLRLRYGQKEAEEILRNYYADTERAQGILQENPNPLNQKITIEGVEYDFFYSIVPQGGVMIEKDTQNSSLSEKTPIVLGQSFQKGLNYNDLNNSQMDSRGLVQMTDHQKLFYYSKESNRDINKNCMSLFDFLNRKLDRNFSFAFVNIKPYLNRKERRLEIAITDLAASLRDYNTSLVKKN